MDKKLLFVVQKHKAMSLHYDFRLEIGSKLVSWSIPKGPTLDNTKKRLAMRTTDHPLEYGNFEGLRKIAEPVIVWDTGYYVPEIEVEKGVRKVIKGRKEGELLMQKGLLDGEIKFQLFGKRLTGSFALIKTKNFGPKNSWLLIKHMDNSSILGYDANTFESSIISQRSLSEIENEQGT